MLFNKLLSVFFVIFISTNLAGCKTEKEKNQDQKREAAEQQARSGDVSQPSSGKTW